MNTETVDYKVLLAKYINLVGCEEGVTYTDKAGEQYAMTPAELVALDEAREASLQYPDPWVMSLTQNDIDRGLHLYQVSVMITVAAKSSDMAVARLKDLIDWNGGLSDVWGYEITGPVKEAKL